MNARRFCILHNTAHTHLSYLTIAMGEIDWVKIQTTHRILRYSKVFQPSSQSTLDSLMSPITYPTFPTVYDRNVAAIFIRAKLFTLGKQIL